MRFLPMCVNCCKIKAYLGFAKKSRNIIYGVDDIIKQIKRCEVILISDALASSSQDKLLSAAKKQNIKNYIIAENEFVQKLDNMFIKAIAITDKNLSDAIKKELD